jgi:hypothetical protein
MHKRTSLKISEALKYNVNYSRTHFRYKLPIFCLLLLLFFKFCKSEHRYLLFNDFADFLLHCTKRKIDQYLICNDELEMKMQRNDKTNKIV